MLQKKKSATSIGISLFSHLVAKALFSALQGLTSVFGMGTGGPPASSTPTDCSEFYGSPNWARTSDIMINSHALYRLSYGGICLHLFRCILSGDSCGNRTRVAGVRGRSLNRLTNEPFFKGLIVVSPLPLVHHQGLEPGTP